MKIQNWSKNDFGDIGPKPEVDWESMSLGKGVASKLEAFIGEKGKVQGHNIPVGVKGCKRKL